MKNTIEISKSLYEIFKQLEEVYKKKKTIIFITDNELEKVPFEIIGKRSLLEETRRIVYMPSLLSTFLNTNNADLGNRAVSIVKSKDKSIAHELELIALKESGISHKLSEKANSNFWHLNGKIFIDS